MKRIRGMSEIPYNAVAETILKRLILLRDRKESPGYDEISYLEYLICIVDPVYSRYWEEMKGREAASE